MKLMSHGMKYAIAYDEDEKATGFFFYGDGRGGAIYGRSQLIAAAGIVIDPEDEPLDEPIPDDVRKAALKVLDSYRRVQLI